MTPIDTPTHVTIGAPGPGVDRHGDWLQSASGRRIWPLDPRVEDVDIRDIAHALARLCRFGGHCKPAIYSVAEHSVRASYVVEPARALEALMHDAAEAYVGDVVRALKVDLARYREIEKRWEMMIGLALGLGDRLVDQHPEVKGADAIMLATERRDVMGPGPAWNLVTATPLAKRIRPWSVRKAERWFLLRFEELANRRIIMHRQDPCDSPAGYFRAEAGWRRALWSLGLVDARTR